MEPKSGGLSLKTLDIEKPSFAYSNDHGRSDRWSTFRGRGATESNHFVCSGGETAKKTSETNTI